METKLHLSECVCRGIWC